MPPDDQVLPTPRRAPHGDRRTRHPPRADSAQKLSETLLAGIGQRWLHVQEVARAADELSAHLGTEESDLVVASAWLHDIGYADPVAQTGLHSVDGANYLQALGYPSMIVSLVAHHTGAKYEAEERMLLDELRRFPAPPKHLLDALTTADLSVGPSGLRMTPGDRIAEILQRYAPEHPVHHAIQRSTNDLLSSVERTYAGIAAASRVGHNQPV